MKRTYGWITGLSLILTLLAGCGWLPRVNWCRPGPAPYQQQEAVRFDPYPENDLGPPVLGGRPQSYENPPAEPVRARQHTGWARWWPWQR